MKVKLLDRTIEVSDENKDIHTIPNLIRKEMEKANLYISYMIIDGEEIYEDYDEYLLEHGKDIEEIVVKARTLKELVLEVLISSDQYIKRMAPAVQVLADDFYREEVEVWDKLSQLIEGIQWLMDSFTMIDRIPTLIDLIGDYVAWNEYAQNIKALQEMVAVMEEPIQFKDSILLADLIKYEILPLLASMQNKLKKIVAR